MEVRSRYITTPEHDLAEADKLERLAPSQEEAVAEKMRELASNFRLLAQMKRRSAVWAR